MHSKGDVTTQRGRSGEKEETDINKLAEEYLRLAFHGLRAKDRLSMQNLRPL